MVLILAVFVSMIVLAVVLISGDDGSDNTDPKLGDVYIGNGVYKFCDESTLVYDGGRGGVSVLENSPECK